MIQILVDWLGYSFRKVSMLTVKGFHDIGYRVFNVVNYWFPLAIQQGTKSIVIGDTITAFANASRFKMKKIYWVDSPLEITNREINAMDENSCLYTASSWWCRYYNKIGLRCDGYIPRPIDVEVAESVLNVDCSDLISKYGDYIVTVASDQTFIPPKKPRKGLDLFDAVCERLGAKGVRCIAVTNWRLRNSIVVRSGSLDEYNLLKLVKCAKLFLYTSRSEGFGLPPIEAMAVKQLVVVSNAPIYDHVIGIKFDYEDEIQVYMPEAGRRYIGWDIKVENVVDAVDYALSLSDEEREKIVEKAYISSKAYTPLKVALALNEVYTYG